MAQGREGSHVMDRSAPRGSRHSGGCSLARQERPTDHLHNLDSTAGRRSPGGVETLAHAPPDVTTSSKRRGGVGAGLLPPRAQVQMALVPLVHFSPFDGIFRYQGTTTFNCASPKSDAGLRLLHPRPAPLRLPSPPGRVPMPLQKGSESFLRNPGPASAPAGRRNGEPN